MFVIEASATFPYAVAEVFTAAARLEATLHWQAGVVGLRRSRAGHAAPGLDRRLRLLYFALGTRHALLAAVTARVAPHRFAYRADGAAFALEVALTFEPDLGGTRVDYRSELRTSDPADPTAGAAAAQAAAALRRLLVRRAAGDLPRLERYVGREVRRQRVGPAREDAVLAALPVIATPATEPAAVPDVGPAALPAALSSARMLELLAATAPPASGLASARPPR